MVPSRKTQVDVLDLLERGVMVRECPTHGTDLGLPIRSESGVSVRCGRCGAKLEAVEYVPATERGAVSPALDERDDETERRLLDRMERAGLLKDGMTATDAREALDA